MINRYQELLNECIDLQEHNRILQIFKQMQKIMKGDGNEQTITKKPIQA